MTYQYQEVKKTEEKQEPDLFNYEQQHQDIAQGLKQSKEQQSKEQQTKKGETGYEADSSEESRITHNKKMEELYGEGKGLKRRPHFYPGTILDKKITQQNANNEKSHYATDEQEEKARQHNKKEGERVMQQNVQPNPGLKSELFFPTVIHRGSLPIADKINPLLIKHCYKLKKEWEESGEPKLNRSVKHGWQSKPTIHDLPELEDFTKCLKDAVAFVFQKLKVPEKQYIFMIDTCWYNICPKGGFNDLHVHPGAFLSGVYYLKKPEKSGNINFHDPRKGSVASREPEHLFRGSLEGMNAKAGDILIFPGWLEHSVEPNLDEEDRISISFNASFGYKPGHGYMEDFLENKQKQENEEKQKGIGNAY